MIIYLALIIPLFTAAILFFFFRHKTVWWEFLIPFIVSAIFIFIFKSAVETSMTTDTEYWGGWVTEVRYYEPWDEYIQKTCSRTICSGSGKSRSCTTTYYDCSYVSSHSAYWEARTSNGFKFNIKQRYYDLLVNQFGSKKLFVDMNRDYHSYDGDMYSTAWPGTDKSLEPVTTRHRYENRVRVSSSTFALSEPTIEEFELYKLQHYPIIENVWTQRSILGYDDPVAENKFKLLNAKLGHKKELRVYITIHEDQPRETGFLQERQWQGGNKNEFNVAIGIDKDGNVKWAHTFSWTEETIIGVEVRDFIERQQKLDLIALADFMYTELDQKFKRKHFADFDYLTVDPKTSHVIWCFVITFVINILVSIFAIKNEFDEDSRNKNKRYGRYIRY